MANKQKKADDKLSQNEINLEEGKQIIKNHSLFGNLHISLHNYGDSKFSSAITLESGDIYLNKNSRHTPEEWAHIIAHGMLHLCFDHFNTENMPGYYITDKDGKSVWKEDCDRKLWNIACDIFVEKFLDDIKFGKALIKRDDLYPAASDEKKIYEMLKSREVDLSENIYGTAEVNKPDMSWNGPRDHYYFRVNNLTYAKEFAYALSNSVRTVINEAGGVEGNVIKSIQHQAAEWFINHYPLLGGLASGFKILEVGYGSNYELGNEISVAAIDVTRREIYVNSAADFSLEEWKFVLAHEYLHAGLQHHERRNGREPFLWNAACDYVINGWLCEMKIGAMPHDGLLYDETLKGFSAEEIYDMIIKDIRRNSKLRTFRGSGACDIMDKGYAETKIMPVSLDDFCKNALRTGLEYQTGSGRGYIPAGLIEEIKALSMPPVPWDVELAKWFEMNFAPVEKRRTYARPSRRQSVSPDIPRPSYVTCEIPENSRTYAVIIDTSGSMTPKMIGIALGAAASYSAAKDVPLVRVVFCDAQPYDIGYVSPEDIAGRVEVQGRGGTVLQPAVDLLEKAKDFPKNGPILIITDGYIENDLHVKREHAFLLPNGNRLPFRPRGKVFYFQE